MYPLNISISGLSHDPQNLLILPQVNVENLPKAEDSEKKPAKNLIFILDVSGSMEQNGKIEAAKKFINDFIDEAGKQDTFSLITFDQQAKVVFQRKKKEKQKDLKEKVDKVSAGGGTTISSGIRQITKNLIGNQNNSEVILLTDGEDPDFNYTDTVKQLESKLGPEWPKKMRIIPIAVGTGGNGTQGEYLQKIAERTGSKSFDIGDTGEDIEGVFDDIKEFIQTPRRTLELLFTNGRKKSIAQSQVFPSLESGKTYGHPILATKALGSLTVKTIETAEAQKKPLRSLKSLKPPKEAINVCSNIVSAYLAYELMEIIKKIQGIKSVGVPQGTMYGGALSQSQDSLPAQDKEIIQAQLAYFSDKVLPDAHFKDQATLGDAIKNVTNLLAPQQSGKAVSNDDLKQQQTALGTVYDNNYSRTMMANRQIEQQSETVKAEIDKLTNRIDSELDWAKLEYNRQNSYYSIDGGLINREVVEVNFLDQPLTENALPLINKPAHPDFLTYIIGLVNDTFKNPGLIAEDKFEQMENYPQLKKASLGQFIEANTGLCRHRALLTAYLLGRSVKLGKFPNRRNQSQKVCVHRGTADNLKAHTWVIYEYEDKNGPHKLLIDTTLPPGKTVYDLNDDQQKGDAIEAYKKIGLHGILRTEKLTPLERISDDVRDLIEAKEDKQTNEGIEPTSPESLMQKAIDKDLICPITREIMFEPVALVFTYQDAKGKTKTQTSIYEKEAIEQWLKKHSLDPKTQLPVGKDVKLYPASKETYDDAKGKKIANPAHKKLNEIFTFLNQELPQPEDQPADKPSEKRHKIEDRLFRRQDSFKLTEVKMIAKAWLDLEKKSGAHSVLKHSQLINFCKDILDIQNSTDLDALLERFKPNPKDKKLIAFQGYITTPNADMGQYLNDQMKLLLTEEINQHQKSLGEFRFFLSTGNDKVDVFKKLQTEMKSKSTSADILNLLQRFGSDTSYSAFTNNETNQNVPNQEIISQHRNYGNLFFPARWKGVKTASEELLDSLQTQAEIFSNLTAAPQPK
jgi:Mg-chelatase subunit ChlD